MRLLTMLAKSVIAVGTVLTILAFFFWFRHYVVGLGVFITSRVRRRPFDELMLPIAPHFSYWRKRYGIVREKDKEPNNNQEGQERPPIPYFGYMIPLQTLRETLRRTPSATLSLNPLRTP